MNPEQLLSQLQPLRAPDPVGFWPMAPVWWLLLIAAVLATTVAVVWLIRRYKRSAYRREGLAWLRELEARNADVYALSTALKTTALKVYPPETVAGLSGTDWPQFLRRSCPKFSGTALSILTQTHAPKPSTPDSTDWQNAQLWMQHHEVPRA
jgi:hypothetical protein